MTKMILLPMRPVFLLQKRQACFPLLLLKIQRAGWKASASGFHSAWINMIIGTIELTQNNPDLSQHYFLESLKYWKKTNNSEMIVLLNDRLTG